MTPEQVRDWFVSDLCVREEIKLDTIECEKVMDTCIEALKELEQYRAIGTVRQVQDFIEDWRKFRELGNLEELKALKENSFFNFDSPVVRIDEKSYNKAIDEMQGNLIRNSRTEVIDGEICLIVTDKRIKQIAERMKGGEER